MNEKRNSGIPVSRTYFFRLLAWLVLLLLLNQVIYAAVVPVLFFQSPYFDADYRENTLSPELEEISIHFHDGTLYGWKYGTRQDKVLLYFGGDNADSNRWIHTVMKHNPELIRNEATILTIDYPTFGKSTGTISEKAFYETALLLYEYASDRYPDADIIPIGYSIGTAAALRLACVAECKALILVAPMYDGTSLYLPRKSALHSMFEPFASVKMQNDQDAPKCQERTLVIASRTDKVTKLQDILALCKLFPEDPELFILNDCPHAEFWINEQVYRMIGSFITI